MANLANSGTRRGDNSSGGVDSSHRVKIYFTRRSESSYATTTHQFSSWQALISFWIGWLN